MSKANLLIATVAEQSGDEPGGGAGGAAFFRCAGSSQEGMLNRVEAAIRCFDPCLSCSTHALGQMPLVVELRGAGGELLQRVER